MSNTRGNVGVKVSKWFLIFSVWKRRSFQCIVKGRHILLKRQLGALATYSISNNKKFTIQTRALSDGCRIIGWEIPSIKVDWMLAEYICLSKAINWQLFKSTQRLLSWFTLGKIQNGLTRKINPDRSINCSRWYIRRVRQQQRKFVYTYLGMRILEPGSRRTSSQAGSWSSHMWK